MGKMSPDLLAKSRTAITPQRKRERELVALAKRDRDEDRIRRSAEIAYANGDEGALKFAKIGPTPEQVGQGFFERYTSKLDSHMDVRADTVRRVLIPHVVRLHHAGFIEEEGLIACRWYRDTYEATGLTGNIASTDYSREVFAQPGSRDMFNDWQIDCQDCIRAVRDTLTKKYLQFFDAIVLHDVAPQKALRLAKKRNGSEGALFREMAKELQDCYSNLKR